MGEVMKFRLLMVMALLVAACGATEEGTSSEQDQAPTAATSTATTAARTGLVSDDASRRATLPRVFR